jgi:hypothetical protein
MSELETLVKNIAKNGRASPPGVVSQLRILQKQYPQLTDRQALVWIREVDVVLANALECL